MLTKKRKNLCKKKATMTSTKTPEQMAEEYAEEKSRADYIGSDGERKWYRSGRGTFSRVDFLAGYQAAKQQWISVKERLPEEGFGWTMIYGCILSRWSVQPGFYDREANEWVSRFISGYEGEEGYAPFESVTHWMPLPKPPEDK